MKSAHPILKSDIDRYNTSLGKYLLISVHWFFNPAIHFPQLSFCPFTTNDSSFLSSSNYCYIRANSTCTSRNLHLVVFERFTSIIHDPNYLWVVSYLCWKRPWICKTFFNILGDHICAFICHHSANELNFKRRFKFQSFF